MFVSNRMPPVPSPEPGGFVLVGDATNKDLKQNNNKNGSVRECSRHFVVSVSSVSHLF